MPVQDTNLLPCGVLVLDTENHIVSLNPYGFVRCWIMSRTR